MRNLLLPTLALGLLAVAAHATQAVHVVLRPSAVVTADADGFFSLGAIADLSGGDAAERSRLRGVPVGRAPIPTQTRLITPGDVLLKMRQAGLNPDTGIVLDGAKRVAITLSAPSAAPTSTDSPARSVTNTAPAAPNSPLVRRGDLVTILMQDGDLTISAKGVARDAGGAGDAIHVHRDGLGSDLSVTVVDAQTVLLEL